MSSYLEVIKEVYAEAARNPDRNLCCNTATGGGWNLPDLRLPQRMLTMNYGCGSTVDPRDVRPDDTVLYVGVGGGLEALQFAYFNRRPGGVLAVDPVAEMRDAAAENLREAARVNPWFRGDFVRILDGDALALPVEKNAVTLAAQNCLFNTFREEDLRLALAEIIRVLRPRGRFCTSDPITTAPLPAALANNDVLRARCLSGCLTYERYLQLLTEAGFGRVEVRARVPYRVLAQSEFPELDRPILLESVEVVAFKTPAETAPAIFSGRTATYVGVDEAYIDDGGTNWPRGQPLPVSDADADRLSARDDFFVTASSFSGGAGCCS
jgi:ubiquinone/menaquinone biosynthesis C-methylase UbiE